MKEVKLEVDVLTFDGEKTIIYTSSLAARVITYLLQEIETLTAKGGQNEPRVIASEQRSDLANGAVADFVNKYGLECPSSSNCNNGGILAEHGCNGTEEDCQATCPVPVQCEFCYTEPRSKFNLENDLKELLLKATASL